MSDEFHNNLLLRTCDEGALNVLSRAVRWVRFEAEQQFPTPEIKSGDLFFPISGLLYEALPPHVMITMTGPEGVVGNLFLEAEPLNCHSLRVLFAADGFAIPAHIVAQEPALSGLRAKLTAFHQSLFAQAAENFEAAAKVSVDRRVARILVMIGDRVGCRDELRIRHHDLAFMLGVRRPGVTVALHVLEGKHLITSRRSFVRIHDLAGLRDYAGCYGRAESAYERLVGTPFRVKAPAIGKFEPPAIVKDADGLESKAKRPGNGSPEQMMRLERLTRNMDKLLR